MRFIFSYTFVICGTGVRSVTQGSQVNFRGFPCDPREATKTSIYFSAPRRIDTLLYRRGPLLHRRDTLHRIPYASWSAGEASAAPPAGETSTAPPPGLGREADEEAEEEAIDPGTILEAMCRQPDGPGTAIYKTQKERASSIGGQRISSAGNHRRPESLLVSMGGHRVSSIRGQRDFFLV